VTTDSRQQTPPGEPLILGWREWIALPDLGLPSIKAKIDTGARTSALHASDIELLADERVRFVVHPAPLRPDIAITCVAKVVGNRSITSSNGEREHRIVISTRLAIADRQWLIEITLTNRETMRTRMLLGRQALQVRQAGGILVDPAAALHQPRLGYKVYPQYARRKRH
jgi:ribosomal protein S6--L-glutamate ligase